MEIAVLGFVGSKNIGDYIQTKAAIDIIDSKKITDKESCCRHYCYWRNQENCY